MTSPVTPVLESFRAPAAFRDELRARVATVDGLRQAASALARAIVRLPDDVLGGSLLDLVGGHLRDSLDGSAPTEAVAERSGARGRSSPGDRDRAGSSPSLGAAVAEAVEKSTGSRPGAAPVSSAARPAPPGRQGQVGPPRAGEPLAALPETPSAGRREPSDTIAVAGSGPFVEPPTVAPAPQLPPAGPGTTLAAALREYRTASTSPAPGAPGASDTPGPALVSSSTGAPAGSAPVTAGEAPARPSPPWVETAAAATARQLERFVAGGTAVVGQQHLGPDGSGGPEVQNVFYVSVGQAVDGRDQTDLGDQLAAILREQALEHGVELS